MRRLQGQGRLLENKAGNTSVSPAGQQELSRFQPLSLSHNVNDSIVWERSSGVGFVVQKRVDETTLAYRHCKEFKYGILSLTYRTTYRGLS